MTVSVSGGTAIFYSPTGRLTKAFEVDLEAQEIEVRRGSNGRMRIRISIADILNVVDPRGTTYQRMSTSSIHV